MSSLTEYTGKLEALARNLSLDYYPVEFEVVPPAFMMEVAVYGLPVRMPHWSFGVRYIYQFIQHKMGHSRIFEVVFPGNPGRAYLSSNNSVQENTLVVAHVLGHADFAKNNLMFKHAQEQVGYHIVELAAAHARTIQQAINDHGQQRVEAVMDAALAIEQHIDDHQAINRPRYQAAMEGEKTESREDDHFRKRFESLPGMQVEVDDAGKFRHLRQTIPPNPEYDLLWFIAHYAPDMEDWERDIFLSVREESFYFHPVFECNIMNEGWASYWHARLLREADFLPDELYLDAMKSHSDVVRPYASGDSISLSVNPYHLGFVLWERIIEQHGLDAARQIMSEEADTGFVRNYLTGELAAELGFFTYTARHDGEIKAGSTDLDDVHETLLRPKYNFGAPRIAVTELGIDGSLELKHEHEIDGRGLDLQRAEKVLEYIQRIWRRPVVLQTVDMEGREHILEVT